METKAHYTAVGGFVLGFLIVIATFLIWISGGGLFHKTRTLEIIFGRISGIQEGSPVRYHGVDVGQISKIRINPKIPSQIIVTAKISDTVPIKQDTVASVEAQGITGTSYILFSGGSDASPSLYFSSKEIPQLAGRSSSLETVLEHAPGVLDEISSLTSDLHRVVNTENREALHGILSNVKDITDTLKTKKGGASLGEEITKTIQTARRTMEEIEATAKEIRVFLKTTQSLPQMFEEIGAAAKEIRLVFAENRQNVKNFTGSGLPAFTRFLNEAKDTMTTFNRVGQSIERSPLRFLHKDPEQGVHLK